MCDCTAVLAFWPNARTSPVGARRDRARGRPKLRGPIMGVFGHYAGCAWLYYGRRGTPINLVHHTTGVSTHLMKMAFNRTMILAVEAMAMCTCRRLEAEKQRVGLA